MKTCFHGRTNGEEDFVERNITPKEIISLFSPRRTEAKRSEAEVAWARIE
ncbi:MAG: hypothetical protein IJ062_04365 [Firmicutes bacterium]|nr:hypothetical protein [Bacillota bacterium]